MICFQHGINADQQRKIMQEIQILNKKLGTSNHYNNKNIHIKLDHKKPTPDEEQKYFSQQCDNLFNDQNFANNQNDYEDSLFNSNSDMLLGNQYEKEVKNFKEFQTNKFSSLHRNINAFAKNSVQVGKQNVSYQNNISKDSFDKITQKTTTISNSRTSVSKTPSHSNLNTKSKLKPSGKPSNIAEIQIKKYIENKQNIFPTSNIQQRQKSYIKEVRKKIRFQTQPDYPTANCRQDSLEEIKYNQQSDSNFNHLVSQAPGCYSKSKSKYDTNRNSLQCTFKPNILKKSHEIAENLQPSFERLTQDIGPSKSQSKLPYKTKEELTSKKYSVKRLQQLSQPRKTKLLTQNDQPKLDFKPQLSKKSLQQMANCTMDVASRNKLWLQQKQAKITRLKHEQEQKKNKQQSGSYAPKITPYKGESDVHLSRFTKEGISSYFQRVSMAKQRNTTQDKKTQQPKIQMKEINVNMKKKTYDQAVRQLHKKILAMNL